jgi:prepilin-type N-terminal cleavage/methylation domain-containing protein
MLRNKKGFTLLELLIVLAIAGILAGIGIPVVKGDKKPELRKQQDCVCPQQQNYYEPQPYGGK